MSSLYTYTSQITLKMYLIPSSHSKQLYFSVSRTQDNLCGLEAQVNRSGIIKGEVLAFVFIFHIHSLVSVSYFTTSSTPPDKNALSGMKYREKLMQGSFWRNTESAFIISDKSMVLYLPHPIQVAPIINI